MNVRDTLQTIMAERILILDGAMGTMIQRHKLEEEDYRGERFADWESPLKGMNDLLECFQLQSFVFTNLQIVSTAKARFQLDLFDSTCLQHCAPTLAGLNLAGHPQVDTDYVDSLLERCGNSLKLYLASCRGIKLEQRKKYSEKWSVLESCQR